MTYISRLFAYITLGLVQGISEPIPISSSGHLVIFKAIFENHLGIEFPNVTSDLAFDVLLHLASLLAIMFYYRFTILKLLQSFFSYIFSKKSRETENDFKYCLYIIIGSIPAAIVGILFEDKIDAAFDNVKLVGCALIVTSIFLMLIHLYGSKGKRTKKKMTFLDAIIVGLFQMVAIIPGISRSGSTMTGGMFSGLTQKSARDYSFFLFMPAAFGSVILKLDDLLACNLKSMWLPYILSFVICIFATYGALRILFSLLKKRKMYIFSIYCFVMGIITIIFI